MNTRSITTSEALVLVDRQEGHFWDHKSSRSGGATIEKIAVALANADGGEFIVGVEDARSSSGVDRWQGFETIEDANFIHQSLMRNVDPTISYTVEWLSIAGHAASGICCLVSVEKSTSVHRTSSGSVYVRRGAQSLEIKGQSITDLTLSKGAKSYEKQPIEGYTATDLADESELLDFLSHYSPATEVHAFIKSNRLADRTTGEATVAAAVLFADNPSAVVPKRCAIKVARYNTKSSEPKREHLDSIPISIEAPAKRAIDTCIDVVTKLIQEVKVLGPDGSMSTMTYPPEALKELVVNAIIHRDYNVSDDILVLVYDNRVEIRSPGRLPGFMTLENLLTDRYSRNPDIVRIINKYPDPPNKDIGEGLNTVVVKMAEAKLKAPRFTVEDNAFVAVLEHQPLARPHEIVLKYLENHDEITNSIARSLTGISSENSMKEVFYLLKKAGKLEPVPGKGGNKSAWRLT